MIDEVHRWLKLMVAVLVATVFGVLAPSTTTASAIAYSYDLSAIARVEVDAYAASEVGFAQVAAQWEGSASPSVKAQAAPTTPPASFVATNTATSRTFGIADRVAGQLDDVRLGSLRGQLGADDLQRLVNAPGAQRYYDTATGNINVIQQVDDVLLRITTASDEFKIISVGPIRPNQVTNGVTNGRFVPIGGAG